MKRQVLEDGHWFDLDRAESWTEATFWGGNNHVSRATGSQWDHEELYLTRGGRWVIHWWSQWQGARDRWYEVEPDMAARWFVLNQLDPHVVVEREYNAREI